MISPRQQGALWGGHGHRAAMGEMEEMDPQSGAEAEDARGLGRQRVRATGAAKGLKAVPKKQQGGGTTAILLPAPRQASL